MTVARRQYKDPFKLTQRENEIMEALEQGLSNSQIAQKLGLTSISNQITVIYEKLGAEERNEAIQIWKERKDLR